MQLIDSNLIKTVTVSNQPNGKRYLIITAHNDAQASMLRDNLGDRAILGYEDPTDQPIYNLHVDFPNSDQYMDIRLTKTDETLGWLDSIHQKNIVEVWICYPDKNSSGVRRGDAIPIEY